MNPEPLNEVLQSLREMVAAYGGDRDYTAEDCTAAYENARALLEKYEPPSQ
jgi:hypothetical protein